ncbi:MAG: thioredoxin family protein [Candidatus Wildermuthbacteria bacterium]|nr:thioredoxin family protein [Candidatus Wildermuthbacteria bacterium]
MEQLGLKKYALVFVITSIIFGVAFLLSNFVYQKRVEEMKSLTNQISLNILSSEVQYNLLAETSCEQENDSLLSGELDTMSERIAHMESQRGVNDAQVLELKKSYSLLQIKDYLLLKKVKVKCKSSPLFVLYFYSNQGECDDCKKEGYVLTDMRKEYPELRIYSFDYHLDIPAIKTLRSIYKVKETLPALIIGEKTHYGFKNKEDIETLLPDIKKQLTKTP